MKVLKRFISKTNTPPCVVVYLYSLDNGKTWITEKEYHKFVKEYFTFEMVY